ncbi:c-type cytochrome [Cohnella silvisoli]|uniref:Cytochrome c n=1 Tax=Cohnella silvisoli TaxID=2873699 RepID=A0ABV1L0V0_9BACL|nr:cytochrome c [Cohnella silvisoli]MCD9025356.1 cytochrome c [Cohnella silvisoli]
MQKWLMAGLVCLACIVGAVLLLTGLPQKEQSAERDNKIVVPDRAVDASASEQLYKISCLSCHGDQMQGKLGPELTHVGTQMSKEEIYKQIANGGGGMPAFKERLTEDQLLTLTTWLGSLK